MTTIFWKMVIIYNLLFYQYLIWCSDTDNKLVIVGACILTILTSMIYPNMPKLIKHPLIFLSVLVCFGLVGEIIFEIIHSAYSPNVIDIRRFLIYT
jgi:hypothetical protein